MRDEMILENLESLIEQVESGFGKIVKYVQNWSERPHDQVIVKPEIKAPDVHVNVPKQAAPIVNVSPVVNIPEIKIPEIKIPQPHVVVQNTSAKKWKFDIGYDRDGDIVSIVAERVE
jgi:hypothetical protein